MVAFQDTHCQKFTKPHFGDLYKRQFSLNLARIYVNAFSYFHKSLIGFNFKDNLNDT